MLFQLRNVVFKASDTNLALEPIKLCHHSIEILDNFLWVHVALARFLSNVIDLLGYFYYPLFDVFLRRPECFSELLEGNLGWT